MTDPRLPAPALATFPKTCAVCGSSYTAAEWQRLRLRGHTGDEIETLEYRDCRAPCQNTLVISVMRRQEASGA